MFTAAQAAQKNMRKKRQALKEFTAAQAAQKWEFPIPMSALWALGRDHSLILAGSIFARYGSALSSRSWKGSDDHCPQPNTQRLGNL